MTDLEINRRLALAIGWSETRSDSAGHKCYVYFPEWEALRVFDYRYWNVIGPIATWYGCFPLSRSGKWVLWMNRKESVEADTPQKAIALAVIAAARAKK